MGQLSEPKEVARHRTLRERLLCIGNRVPPIVVASIALKTAGKEIVLFFAKVMIDNAATYTFIKGSGVWKKHRYYLQTDNCA